MSERMRISFIKPKRQTARFNIWKEKMEKKKNSELNYCFELTWFVLMRPSCSCLDRLVSRLSRLERRRCVWGGGGEGDLGQTDTSIS